MQTGNVILPTRIFQDSRDRLTLGAAKPISFGRRGSSPSPKDWGAVHLPSGSQRHRSMRYTLL